MTASELDADERLRRMEAVVDVSLSEMGADQLLAELLDRVRRILRVDVAVVLHLDPHARQLMETAVSGRPDGSAGHRDPAWSGLAARIVRDRLPVAVAGVDSAASDLRSLAAVPLLANADVVGVLQVGSCRPRRFSAEDVQLLQLAADRATQASQAGQAHLDRAAALALQRSLLPPQLPEVSGVDMAARYLPGHDIGVGGDWYDVFLLPSGWLGVVIGDVAGHGLRAAVVMGRLRSALRAYALECPDPAEVLTRLDRKIRHFEPEHLATALYAMLPPDRNRIHLSLAGHPPPARAAPDRPAELLDLPVDHPLGFGGGHPRRTTVLDFPDDTVLVCYTDGLVERRGEPIDEGLHRLRATIEPGPAETVCTTVMANLVDDRPTDDIALLAIRRRSTGAAA
ncbi:GAF domain-containing SpoIIE family protein phosphatase [Micromonospora sp. WMMD1082]|uniref:PP2C family protein-serine/threonine phosphatase n=1 Tax=Micromonospora sp. WMMD1082 TaxID=3016104 RepID=UPI002416262E|nr:GAF domain-containing SpoIIE family protein phosphatase [Micromonospora sp. WMMD1082]MDG4798242.1 SpoIIE family protein phosphatase [Micromonospora sp. WMMD1082]